MKILGIHGIGHQFVGRNTLRDEWFPRIKDGLEEANERNLTKCPRLELQDFDMVGYGPVFRQERESTSKDLGDDSTPESLDPWELDFLGELWKGAAAMSKESRDDANMGIGLIAGPTTRDQKGPLPMNLAVDALNVLSGMRYFMLLGGKPVILRLLRQVREFLFDPAKKQQILDHVSACRTPDTRIIVAHSLGTIVAYEALCAHPEWRIHSLVTLGSPLGMQNLIFEALTPKPTNHKAVWPSSLRRWGNVADKGDPVALERNLAHLFGNVEDRLAENGWKCHDAGRYLTSKHTGELLTSALNDSEP
jgi:hypothetical protein